MNISPKMSPIYHTKNFGYETSKELEILIEALEISLNERCKEEGIELALVNKVVNQMSNIIAREPDGSLESDLISIEPYSLQFYQLVDDLFTTIENLQRSGVMKPMVSFFAKSFFERPAKAIDKVKEERNLNEQILVLKKSLFSQQIKGIVNRVDDKIEAQEIEYLNQQIKNEQHKANFKLKISTSARKFSMSSQDKIDNSKQNLQFTRRSQLKTENSKEELEIKGLEGELKMSDNVPSQSVTPEEKKLEKDIANLEKEIEQLFRTRSVKEHQCMETIRRCEEDKARLHSESNTIIKELKEQPKRLLDSYNSSHAPINAKFESSREVFSKESDEIVSEWKKASDGHYDTFNNTDNRRRSEEFSASEKKLEERFAEENAKKRAEFDNNESKVSEEIGSTKGLHKEELRQKHNAKVANFHSSFAEINNEYREKQNALISDYNKRNKASLNKFNTNKKLADDKYNTDKAKAWNVYLDKSNQYSEQYDKDLEWLCQDVNSALAKIRYDVNKL